MATNNKYNFINPYNFAPLGKKGKNVSDNSNEKYTGCINYSILTKTPLMIPDMSAKLIEKVKNDEKEIEHFHKVFMSLSNLENVGEIKDKVSDEYAKPKAPFIPGSEVRGMFRSIYEMLTDSCLSVLNTDVNLSKRTHEVFKAGLIRKYKGENDIVTYSLYKADDCIFRAKEEGSCENAKDAYKEEKDKNDNTIWVYSDFETKSYKIKEEVIPEGSKVFFKCKSRESGKTIAKNLSLKESSNSPNIGYILKGLDGPNMGDKKKAEKHNLHIFCKEEKLVKENIDVAVLTKVLEIYKKNNVNDYSEYSKQFKNFCENKNDDIYFPVYYSEINYSEINEIGLFLSPAAITRELYSSELTDKVAGFEPCSEKNELCPACSLFGTVMKENQGAVASKVRFSDLSLENSPNYCGSITLAPLGEPQISNMEFYLERPADNAVFWTYDYYIDIDGIIHKNDKGINGRKYYWHSKNIITSSEKTNLNSTVYPLAEGNKFVGNLYFNNISKNELNKLVFILNCGEKTSDIEEAKHGYKLGLGKPLGLGSIATKVNSIAIRQSDGETYSLESCEIESDGLFSDEVKATFEKITAFDAVEGNVDYPRMKENGDVFEWFSANHKAYRYNNNEHKYKNISSPNSRKQEYFDVYMKPLNPELIKTDVLKIKNNNGGYSKPKFDSSKLKDGNTYTVKIKSVKESTNGNCYAYFDTDGGQASVFAGDKKEGDTIVVKFTGLNEKGYAQFRIVK